MLVQAGIPVHLVVNNASFGKLGHFLDYDRAVNQVMLALNINAVVGLCQLYLPAMLERHDGGIINGEPHCILRRSPIPSFPKESPEDMIRRTG